MLPAPEPEYLTFTGLADWLGYDKRELRQLIDDGTLPHGRTRPKRKNLWWTREDAAVCKWLLDNRPRFAEGESTDGEDAQNGPRK